jgi:hypothetical protein
MAEGRTKLDTKTNEPIRNGKFALERVKNFKIGFMNGRASGKN